MTDIPELIEARKKSLDLAALTKAFHEGCDKAKRKENRVNTARYGHWPLHSEGAAVHPDQIPEAIEHAKKSGVPTEFDRAGRPILTSPAHQRRYLKARGFFNKDGI